MSSISYRPDIDGLRAVAVIGVVLYHAEAFGLSGGFVGVDVFFVISGYLITVILHKEHATTGQISILGFYARRVRRLLPALYAMLLVVSMVVMALYAPGDASRFAGSLMAALGFVSNVFFWRSSGYFSEDAHIAPLLHTWSLAVEEQFYLFWPLVLAVALSRPVLRRLLLPVTGAAFLISLAGAEFGNSNYPQPSFYLLPTRAFELLVGAGLAIMPPLAPRRRVAADAICLLGLGLILGSYVTLAPSTPFPGIATLAPCLGAVFLIAAGERSPLARLVLGNQAMVTIGLLSYSWYLWHWPGFAIWRYVTFRGPTLLEATAIALATLALAWLSWRYVEHAFRSERRATGPKERRRADIRALVSLALFPGLCLAASAFIVLSNDGFPGRVPATVQLVDSQVSSKSSLREACHLVPRDGSALPDEADCIAGSPGKKYTAILWGDSHASHYGPTLDALGHKMGFSFRQMSKSGCPPLLDVDFVPEAAVFKGDCDAFNQNVLALIESDSKINDIWIAAFWPANRNRLDGQKELLADSIKGTVAELRAKGKNVVVFGVLPHFSFPADGCAVRQAMFPNRDISCGLAPDDVEQLYALDEALAESIGQSYISLLSLFCEKGRECTVFHDGVPAFSDSHHLNAYFAKSLATFLQKLQTNLPPTYKN